MFTLFKVMNTMDRILKEYGCTWDYAKSASYATAYAIEWETLYKVLGVNRLYQVSDDDLLQIHYLLDAPSYLTWTDHFEKRNACREMDDMVQGEMVRRYIRSVRGF